MLIANYNLEELIVRTILGGNTLLKFQSGKLGILLDPIVQEIKILSEHYTGHDHGRRDLSIEQAKAYALYYLLINYAKVSALLERLPASLSREPIEILDFGSGPGTASLACLDLIPNLKSLTLFDRAASMRTVAGSILAAHPQAQSKFNILSDREQVFLLKFDLIILANVLNEVEGDRMILLNHLNDCLKPNGIVVILEPALQKTTRELMAIRNEIISNSNLVPIFPCTHAEPCPMLKTKEDWCHNELRWEIPRLVAELDERSGFNKHRLKYAALILQREGVSINGGRIVTFPKKGKIGLTFQLCKEGALTQTIIPKKAKSPELKKTELWSWLP